MELAPDLIRPIVAAALREDLGSGDLTCATAIPPQAQFRAEFIFRQPGVVAGLAIVEATFAHLDPAVRVERLVPEGSHVAAKTAVARVSGPAQAILSGERVALNLFQRLSGIASQTADYVALIAGTRARILDTRKTTPGLRALEKYAVRVGGGLNHRFGLYDGVMLKDNHLALLARAGVGLGEAVRRTRAAVGPMVRVEVEVENLDQALIACEAGAELILLDNMPPDQLQAAVVAIGGRAKLEASGGITRTSIRAVAESGVDYISVGALTHSVQALDIGLDASEAT